MSVLYCCLCIGVKFKKPVLRPLSKSFLCMLSLRIFIVLSVTFKSLIHFWIAFVCLLRERNPISHSLHNGFSVFPTQSFENIILSLCCILGNCYKYIEFIIINLFLSLFCSCWSMCIFIHILYHFNYYNFVIYLKLVVCCLQLCSSLSTFLYLVP